MLKKLIPRIAEKEAAEKARKLLALEVQEISAIAEKLFRRLEIRMKQLAEAEARLDTKISRIEALLRSAGEKEPGEAPQGPDRYREIGALLERGLKVDEIAAILDIPRGEVELILGLRK